MTVRRTRPWLDIVFGFCLALVTVAPAGPAVAADGDLLAGPFVDAALVPGGYGPPGDVLTIATDDVPFGSARLTLLHRDTSGWSTRADAIVSITKDFEEVNTPWLVDLGGGRFAILTTSAQAPATLLATVTVDAAGAGDALTIGEPARFEGQLMEAAAADVDGDGKNEMVVSQWIDGDENGRCVDTTIAVFHLDPSGIRRTESRIRLKDVTAVRISGPAVGEFDGRPGADIVAHAYDTCGPSPDAAEPHHLVAIRLADMSLITDIPSSDEDSGAIVPSMPIVLDVDDDGRDEAVMKDPGALVMVDPTDGWKRLTIAAGDIRPVAVRSRSTGSSPAQVTWVELSTESVAQISSTRVQRVDGSLAAVETSTAPFPDLPPQVLSAALTRLRLDVGQTMPATSASIDLDRDGCPELLLPSVTAHCLGAGPIRAGPEWFDAKPLAFMGPAEDQRLLVAEGLDWYPFQEGPFPPLPSASIPGAWRSGSFEPFFLAEVALPLETGNQAVPAPVVDALTDATGSVELQGPAGGRLLIRARGLADDTSTGLVMSQADFMRREPIDGEYVLIRRLPTAGGTSTSSELSTISFAIAGDVPSSSVSNDRWTVSAMALDASGVASAVTHQVVVYDRAAPPLTLDEAPFTSPPWPFEAKIGGKSEPGATIRLGDGTQVIADATGAFAFTTRLAPWPQTFEAVAFDASGNRSAQASVSVMGGIDLRGLPWPAIAAVAILIAVLLSSLRGTRRVRSIPSVAAVGDEGGDLVIEELDPGSRYRRD